MDEALRVLDAAEAAGITLRLIGGVAVRLRCPSAARPPLARSYKDLDFVGSSSEAGGIQSLLAHVGYAPDVRFNALHGHHRLLFRDPGHERQVDVMLDTFEMCHRLDLRDRLNLDSATLPLADLLLTKMQVVEANEKDLLDCLALLADYPIVEDQAGGIDGAYVAKRCARDWGLWRTLSLNRERLQAVAGRLAPDVRRTVEDRLDVLFARIEREPKTLAWKLRARVGDRIRWYELPEEVG